MSQLSRSNTFTFGSPVSPAGAGVPRSQSRADAPSFNRSPSSSAKRPRTNQIYDDDEETADSQSSFAFHESKIDTLIKLMLLLFKHLDLEVPASMPALTEEQKDWCVNIPASPTLSTHLSSLIQHARETELPAEPSKNELQKKMAMVLCRTKWLSRGRSFYPFLFHSNKKYTMYLTFRSTSSLF